MAYASSLDVVGCLAGSVEDAARLLSAIAGHDRRDATSSTQVRGGESGRGGTDRGRGGVTESVRGREAEGGREGGRRRERKGDREKGQERGIEGQFLFSFLTFYSLPVSFSALLSFPLLRVLEPCLCAISAFSFFVLLCLDGLESHRF